jgi:hypothetical protein
MGCKHCECPDYIKFGKASNGAQRYKCKGCKRYFFGSVSPLKTEPEKGIIPFLQKVEVYGRAFVKDLIHAARNLPQAILLKVRRPHYIPLREAAIITYKATLLADVYAQAFSINTSENERINYSAYQILQSRVPTYGTRFGGKKMEPLYGFSADFFNNFSCMEGKKITYYNCSVRSDEFGKWLKTEVKRAKEIKLQMQQHYNLIH